MEENNLEEKKFSFTIHKEEEPEVKETAEEKSEDIDVLKNIKNEDGVNVSSFLIDEPPVTIYSTAGAQSGTKDYEKTMLMLKIGISVSALILIASTFLPYSICKVNFLEKVTTSVGRLFPGFVGIAFVVLAIVCAGATFLEMEKYIVPAGGLAALLCIKQLLRMGTAGMIVGKAGKGVITMSNGAGYYGMIIGSFGMLVFSVLYIGKSEKKIY